jgi:hypothetical protein
MKKSKLYKVYELVVQFLVGVSAILFFAWLIKLLINTLL